MVMRSRGWSRARAISRVVMMLACGAGSAACAALFGFERLSEEGFEGGTVNEASVEGGTDAPFEAGPQCTEIGVPARPSITDAGADVAVQTDLYLGSNVVDFGIDPNATPVGFNLDRACSPTIATSTCTTGIDDPTFQKYGVDKNSLGVDNAGFGLLSYLGTLGSAFSPTGIRERLGDGEFGVVIRIVDWNRTPDDADVRLEVYPAFGVSKPVDAGAPLVPGGKPRFDSTDRWILDDRYQQPLTEASKIKSASAWVTGGRLVASFQSVTLGVSVPNDNKPLDVIIQEVLISGLLVPSGTSFRLDQGVIGGRWRTADLLDQVRTLYVKDTAPLNKQVLCEPGFPTLVYNQVKKEVCDGRDIRGASASDSTNMPCEAVSVGIRVDTYALDQPGEFATLPAPVPGARCELDGSVPKGDNCAAASP